jgi:hypothetical protein
MNYTPLKLLLCFEKFLPRHLEHLFVGTLITFQSHHIDTIVPDKAKDKMWSDQLTDRTFYE